MSVFVSLTFLLLTLGGLGLFFKKIRGIYALTQQGKPVCSTAPLSYRIRQVLLFGIGQKRMFDKPFVALLHVVIYLSFFLVNVELVEIFLDGLLGTHRFLADKISPTFYGFIINLCEGFAVLVIIACVVFLVRRTLFPVARLQSKDLDGYPKKDGRLILIFECVLMILFLLMNASDHSLTHAPISQQLSTHLLSSFSPKTHHLLFVSSWWLHYVGILFFLNYLPYSKHLHILLGFVNIYKHTPAPLGKMSNMPSIQHEVYLMLTQASGESSGELDTGANDIIHLSQKNLLDAFSCTECGRCSENCPANLSGKMLSPRKIMMSVRDRSEAFITKKDEEKKLMHHYISEEEIYACTSCQACVQTCPVMIDPLSIILQLRRGLLMEEAKAPKEWNEMFSHIEHNFSPWKYPPHERAQWIHTPNA